MPPPAASACCCASGRERSGARVVGTVSTEAKAELARANGCEHPIVTRSYPFAERTRQVSGGRGADVIYDGLGREAAQENLAALATRGHWVSYGQATGPLEPLPAWARSRGPSRSRSSFTTPRTRCNRWRATCSPRCVTAS